MAFRYSGRAAVHNKRRPVLKLLTYSRMQEQPPARRSQFAVHARPHRTNISPNKKGNKRRHAPRQPAGGNPRSDKKNGNHRGVRNNTPNPENTQHACRLPRALHHHRPLCCGQGLFDAMLQAGAERRVEGPWSFDLYLVSKKDSGWGTCGEYRILKLRTIPKRNTVPHTQYYSQFFLSAQPFPK